MSAPLRVVIIDDQPSIRHALSAILSAEADMQVVGSAQNGEEGLKVVFQLQPDVVLLDLEMPKMDGFSFLRLLMSKRPTPVVVVSSQSGRESVFRALELGAMEFVAKPARAGIQELYAIRDDLLEKVRLSRRLKLVQLQERTRSHAQALVQAQAGRGTTPPAGLPAQAVTFGEARRPTLLPSALPEVARSRPPERLLCIGASTGGPASILSLLLALDVSLPVAVLITQHMPENFTRGFAERLERATRWTVREAQAGELVLAGQVLVAAGSFSLRVQREGQGGGSYLRVREPQGGESRSQGFVPSVDRMFESAAQEAGGAVIGVVLTGMAGEGVQGAQAVRAAGGVVLVESPESAVIAGMPEDVIRAGACDEIVPLERMADAVTRQVFRRQSADRTLG